jgi:hypothetical protein
MRRAVLVKQERLELQRGFLHALRDLGGVLDQRLVFGHDRAQLGA